MKKPSLRSLRYSSAQTKRIRASMARQKTIKITINIDAATLTKLRALADKKGVPYQRMINRTLAESLVSEAASESRLERIERELKMLKRKLAA